jgi:hypothetical protein
VLRWLKKNQPEINVRKIADKFHSGYPDLHLCWKGMCIDIELKRPGKNPTPIQEYELKKQRTAGGRTAVCHSLEEVKEFLNEIQKGGE